MTVQASQAELKIDRILRRYLITDLDYSESLIAIKIFRHQDISKTRFSRVYEPQEVQHRKLSLNWV